jgi:hypothetical protein
LDKQPVEMGMTRKSGKRGRFSKISKYRGIFLLACVFGLVAWNGYRLLTHFVAEVHCNTVANSTLNRDQNPATEEIKAAISWDGHNAEYWYKLGQALSDMRSAGEGMSTDEERSENQIQIVKALEQAVRLNPVQARYRVLLGWEYSHLWHNPHHREKWLAAADTAMSGAAYLAGDKDPGLHLSIGNYWIMRSKATVPSDPQWKVAWEQASWHYRKAQSLARGKDLHHDIEDFVWTFYPDPEMIRDVLHL